MKLYHGTRTPPDKILEEGLVLGGGMTKEERRDKILKEYGLELKDVPEWTWKGELEYEKDRPPHLHMSLNLPTAAGYAHQGCETECQIRRHLKIWQKDLDNLPLALTRKLMPLIDKEALEEIGKQPYVYEIEVPDDWITKEDHKRVESIKHIPGEIEFTAAEVHMEHNIPPEMITGVYEIDWRGWDVERPKEEMFKKTRIR